MNDLSTLTGIPGSGLAVIALLFVVLMVKVAGWHIRTLFEYRAGFDDAGRLMYRHPYHFLQPKQEDVVASVLSHSPVRTWGYRLGVKHSANKHWKMPYLRVSNGMERRGPLNIFEGQVYRLDASDRWRHLGPAPTEPQLDPRARAFLLDEVPQAFSDGGVVLHYTTANGLREPDEVAVQLSTPRQMVQMDTRALHDRVDNYLRAAASHDVLIVSSISQLPSNPSEGDIVIVSGETVDAYVNMGGQWLRTNILDTAQVETEEETPIVATRKIRGPRRLPKREE